MRPGRRESPVVEKGSTQGLSRRHRCDAQYLLRRLVRLGLRAARDEQSNGGATVHPLAWRDFNQALYLSLYTVHGLGIGSECDYLDHRQDSLSNHRRNAYPAAERRPMIESAAGLPGPSGISSPIPGRKAQSAQIRARDSAFNKRVSAELHPMRL